jgi:hypothetical protein
MKEEINYILESLRFKTSIYRDKKKRNLTFNDDEYYANILNEYIENLQSQLKAKEEMVKIMEKYFELIIDLGFDYDGFNKADSLKGLIDELVRFAKLGRACNTTEAIYETGNKKFNILHKEILSKGENK